MARSNHYLPYGQLWQATGSLRGLYWVSPAMRFNKRRATVARTARFSAGRSPDHSPAITPKSSNCQLLWIVPAWSGGFLRRGFS